jgi:gamma-glutamylcyclotransferase (GGCT)/AIG2-like uncharacterized protein YtfP
MKIVYFAYGSNMDSEQMKKRVRSATLVGRARLANKRVVFNKRSMDGSGKANLIDSFGKEVWGVLYKFDSSEASRLDEAEGGYTRERHQVRIEKGDSIEAEIYVSTKLTDNPVAYESYKSRVIKGAQEHGLPEDYIAYLESLPSKPDP